ncbi:MAG: hypothetical protein H0U58_00575 [Chloroflexi bacterium]|nr:hypothetical protein [Chloroflexota bacterium]
MTLYAESSAVLAWLLDDVEGGKVEQAQSSSDLVVASELTLVECDRTLLRAVALGEMTQEAVPDLQADLMSVAAGWNIQTIESRIVERARQSSPTTASDHSTPSTSPARWSLVRRSVTSIC